MNIHFQIIQILERNCTIIITQHETRILNLLSMHLFPLCRILGCISLQGLHGMHLLYAQSIAYSRMQGPRPSNSLS